MKVISTGKNPKKVGLSILVLSPFFYPELISTGKYNTHFVKALVEQGIKVSVITFHPLYPDWHPKKTNAKLEGVEIFRGGGVLPYPKSLILRRIKLELLFASLVMRHCLFRKDWDIIVPIFPPSLLFFLMTFFFGKKSQKIAIVHDLQGVLASVWQNPFKKFMLKIIRVLEKKSLHACDKIIFISRSMEKRAISDYDLDTRKTIVCYPFVSLEMQQSTNELNEIFSPQFKHVVYCGAIAEKQNPFELLLFFQALTKTERNICCHLFSRGPLFEELQKTNAGSGERIFFHDLVPEKNLNELYARSDVQIIPQKKSTGDGAIPSKLPNILNAGVPVFAICDIDSELSHLVKEAGIGCAAHTWEAERLVAEFCKFLALVAPESHADRRRKIKNYIEKKFSIGDLIKNIIG